jgi:hypothetical protein
MGRAPKTLINLLMLSSIARRSAVLAKPQTRGFIDGLVSKPSGWKEQQKIFTANGHLHGEFTGCAGVLPPAPRYGGITPAC